MFVQALTIIVMFFQALMTITCMSNQARTAITGMFIQAQTIIGMFIQALVTIACVFTQAHMTIIGMLIRTLPAIIGMYV